MHIGKNYTFLEPQPDIKNKKTMYKCQAQLGCKGRMKPYSRDGELGFDICEDCGIIWRTIDSLEISKSYEQNYFDSKNYKNRRKHKVKKSGWLLDIAQMYHPDLKNLLEVGCSIGYTLEAAKNRQIDHLGIDISSYAIDACRDLGLNARNASFDDLKSEQKKFELIFMQHVLEHFEDPFECLKDCNELLSDNGLVLILVPNSSYKRAVKLKEKHRFYSMEGVGAEHYGYFNYNTLKTVLNVSGFEVVQENYPLFMNRFFSVGFFLNRVFRKSLSIFRADQEILVIARKVKK